MARGRDGSAGGVPAELGVEAGTNRIRHVYVAEPGRHCVLGPPAGAMRGHQPVRLKGCEVVQHLRDERLEYRPFRWNPPISA
jgi:hypothetical protein